MLLVNQFFYHANNFVSIPPETVQDIGEEYLGKFAFALKIAHQYACAWASNAESRVDYVCETHCTRLR